MISKTYIIHWHTVVDRVFVCRGGYTVVHARDKRGARRAMRSEFRLHGPEQLRIDRVEAR